MIQLKYTYRKEVGFMALMNCPNCGKEVSDRAKACPQCGVVLQVEDDTAVDEKKKYCPDCGTESSSDTETCPNCGCPIADDDNIGKDRLKSDTIKVIEVMKKCLGV